MMRDESLNGYSKELWKKIDEAKMYQHMAEGRLLKAELFLKKLYFSIESGDIQDTVHIKEEVRSFLLENLDMHFTGNSTASPTFPDMAKWFSNEKPTV